MFVRFMSTARLSIGCLYIALPKPSGSKKCPGLSKIFQCFRNSQFFIYLLDNIIITDQMALTVHKDGADHYDLAADKLKSLAIPSHQLILLEGFNTRKLEAAPFFSILGIFDSGAVR